MSQSLAATVSYLSELRTRLVEQEKRAAAEAAEIRRLIAENQTYLNQVGAGLDSTKITEAENVLFVRGSFARAGQDRAGVIADAIEWLATGKCKAYRGLDCADFGTKNYDRWQGQRSDHEWGGPAHGSIVFQVGLKDRKRPLTEAEREAAIYYLVNLERIQSAAASARELAAA